jgi:hypothetical protein
LRYTRSPRDQSLAHTHLTPVMPSSDRTKLLCTQGHGSSRKSRIEAHTTFWSMKGETINPLCGGAKVLMMCYCFSQVVGNNAAEIQDPSPQSRSSIRGSASDRAQLLSSTTNATFSRPSQRLIAVGTVAGRSPLSLCQRRDISRITVSRPRTRQHVGGSTSHHQHQKLVPR